MWQLKLGYSIVKNQERVIRKISGYLVVFRKIISDNVHYELIYTDNARINTHKLFENIYE